MPGAASAPHFNLGAASGLFGGNMDDELDTREAFRSTSPYFGALLCPAVVVVKDDEPAEEEAT